MIVATDHINPTGWPPDQGRSLADAILAAYDPWPAADIQVNLNLPAAMLVGTFINSILQRVHEQRPEALVLARKTKWHAPFTFQRELIAKWVEGFQPVG